jgi:hypothetical protein
MRKESPDTCICDGSQTPRYPVALTRAEADELRDLLARIPRRSTVVLTSSKGRAWRPGSLGDRVVEAKKKAWPKGTDLHFHDLRGTAATKFYLAGLSERAIAEILAWEEGSVSRIIRRYVGRQAEIKDRIKRLNETRRRT